MTSTSRGHSKSTARAKNAAVVKAAGAPGHVLVPGDVPRRRWRTDLVDPVLAFVVYGIPAGQGSKRPAGVRNGKPIMAEQSVYVGPWRDAVRQMARTAILDYTKRTGCSWKPLDEPVMVSAVITVPATQAATDRGDTYHQGTPDLDKMERALGDALSPTPLKPGEGKGYTAAQTNKIRAELMERRRKHCVLHDDSRIVAWDHVTKVYPATTVDSLGYSGVVIQVWRMADLERAARVPARRDGDTITMRAADIATWARPATGEPWEVAAKRLWKTPGAVLATSQRPVTLRGRAIADEDLSAVLCLLATQGPEAHVVVEVKTRPRLSKAG